MYAAAKVHTNNGDAAAAFAAYDALLEAHGKKMSTSSKIQINLNCVRLSLFHSDLVAAKGFLDKTRKLVEEGGDWDRRNRLRVYEGHYFLLTRNFSAASKVFLDSVPTFTAVEVCSFEKLVLYAATCGVLMLDRATVKDKLVASPEVIAVSRETPFLGEFVKSLYECRYADFFRALVGMQTAWRADRFLAPHVPWLLREMRVRAYVQFLTSYRSVTLAATAAAFGVSPDYVDAEFSRFIAAGRLNAKIDKVSGIVETNQPDARNAQYQKVIKQGDLLLNRVQKLARVVNV
jgi:26S proteasome regulatory subunit N7